jgi:hypothetical protein
MISAGSCPQVCTGLHDIHFTGPRRPGLPYQRYTHAQSLSTGPGPPCLHRPAQACTSSISLGHAPQACQAGDAHMHVLRSAGLGPPGLHRPAGSLPCQAMPPRPPCLRYTYTRSPFHWAVPSRPAQACIISTLQACAPKACQAGDPHTHNLLSAGQLPQGLLSWGSTDTQDLHSTGLCHSGTPGPCSKGPLFHLS